MPELPARATQISLDVRISDLKQNLADGDYVINRRYQRNKVGVYKPEFRTRLIESVIRGFPIPPILAKEEGEVTEIIDGQQRITTICDFIDGQFALDGEHLMVLNNDEYHGLFYGQLPQDHRHRITRDPLKVHVITDDMPSWKIFVLINGGMNKLSKQELRKAAFSEFEHYWIIDNLVQTDFWQNKLSNAYKKFEKDAELLHKALISYLYGDDEILRNLSTSEFVEEGLTRIINDYTPEELSRVVTRFQNQCLGTIAILFHEQPNQPFRRKRVLAGTTSAFSATYVPIMAYAFGKLRRNFQQNRITQLRDELVSEFDYFMSVDDENPQAEKSTAGNIPSRFLGMAEDLYGILSDLMGDEPGLLRSTQHRIPQQLANTVLANAPTDQHGRYICGIEECGLPIPQDMPLDIDHIQAVADGGQTIAENLRVTHSSCNRGRI